MTLKRSASAIFVLSCLTLTACGGSSGGGDSTPPVTNNAPTDISLSSAVVDENAMGATIGTLSATDADSGDSFTFTTSNSSFAISGTSLTLAEGVAMNFEANSSVDVAVTVTDAAGSSFSKTLTVSVNDLLDTYQFNNKNGEGSSVSYSGQTARHVLIAELNNYIGNQLQTDLGDGTLATRAEVLAKLDSYFRMDADTYELTAESMLIGFTADPEQISLKDISSSHKNLVAKVAGNDAGGQHAMWNDGDFAGWGAKGSTTPEGLVDIFFGLLADNADEILGGASRVDADGNPLPVYVTSTGLDLKQLIQKFLLMSVAYSQGADDYLDNNTAGKGLLADNSANVTGKPYTALEHIYDEGFGYFGAARDYLDYSDDEVASKGGRDGWQGKHDTDNNGTFDLLSEYNFGNSVNAAKRDRGATTELDYSKTAMDNFLLGRQLIADTNAALTEAQMTELEGYVSKALDAWERSIVATVVHYINDTSADLANFDSDNFNFTDTAKHWAEMKGFALGIQFNRASPMTSAQFEQLHNLLADAPVLTDAAAVTQYRADLMTARDLIETVYGFDAADVANW
ncbi:DUF4856 domain-containing protein [uncultured Ferrimonas sp.]|uniref:DUF4856 domain-containing protein n=1 Tax=uncultured Ferrimonas sp. TaxID=432640 RepID=UPI0026126062|nr:DUF4856 domain-containing protein [uncultured Ferrimonas sp.]